MTCRFQADPDPDRRRCDEIAGLAPRNPFYTAPYLAARAAQGAQPWLLSLVDEDGALVTGCSAFASAGRLRRELEITSLPRLPEGDDFWQGLLRFCRDRGVGELSVNSYASESAAPPALAPVLWRRRRAEYRLALAGPDAWERLSAAHAGQIARGQETGLAPRRTRDPAASEVHVQLIAQSLERHGRPASQVPAADQARHYAHFLAGGCGELFQVQLGETTVSSVLVLEAPRAGYYQSAGTSALGMQHGAAHFVVREIAEALRRAGKESFNLGGVDADQPGASAFKEGFGGERVELESACFQLGSRLQRALRASAESLLPAARRLLRGRGR